ncbi:hypothetical protein HZH66_007658 [Vespula vulgaris]|uniref:Uncharacterized protein n=1 Tax=Vespula vulgaris TaxID=7454 RepID=A0A834K3V9_VESVU|nr:hypothetical protein HZH66_007658 [Vespula vulgaris]
MRTLIGNDQISQMARISGSVVKLDEPRNELCTRNVKETWKSAISPALSEPICSCVLRRFPQRNAVVKAKTVLVVTVLPSINDLQFRETDWETSVSRSVHPRELSYIICKMDFYADRELGVIIAPRDVTVSSYNCLTASSAPPSEKEVNVLGSVPLGKELGQEPISAPSQCLSEYASEGKSPFIGDLLREQK